MLLTELNETLRLAPLKTSEPEEHEETGLPYRRIGEYLMFDMRDVMRWSVNAKKYKIPPPMEWNQQMPVQELSKVFSKIFETPEESIIFQAETPNGVTFYFKSGKQTIYVLFDRRESFPRPVYDVSFDEYKGGSVGEHYASTHGGVAYQTLRIVGNIIAWFVENNPKAIMSYIGAQEERDQQLGRSRRDNIFLKMLRRAGLPVNIYKRKKTRSSEKPKWSVYAFSMTPLDSPKFEPV